MRYVRLGKTNLEVSAIAFGTWAFGGEWGTFDADEAKGAIHRAIDLGITLFDTAQAYGFGVSERLLLCGLYGLKRMRGDEPVTVPEAERWRGAIEVAAQRVRGEAASGVTVEDKGLGMT